MLRFLSVRKDLSVHIRRMTSRKMPKKKHNRDPDMFAQLQNTAKFEQSKRFPQSVSSSAAHSDIKCKSGHPVHQNQLFTKNSKHLTFKILALPETFLFNSCCTFVLSPFQGTHNQTPEGNGIVEALLLMLFACVFTGQCPAEWWAACGGFSHS